MTEQDIIKLAQKFGLTIHGEPMLGIKAFALAIAEVERKECAKVAEKYHVPMADSIADVIASTIRARK